MCFSAAASFSAGVILSGAVIVAARKVEKPSQRAFAAIPGIFAIQQFTECFVWLSLTNESFSGLAQSSALGFLFWAEVLWPMWIPFAMLLLEKDKTRRKVFLGLLGVGLALSIHTIYHLIAFPFSAQIVGHHIQYKLGITGKVLPAQVIAYGIVAVGPAFVSTVPKMRVLGILIALSFLVTKVFFPNYIISVWCFFAAILSIIVVYILAEIQKKSMLKAVLA